MIVKYFFPLSYWFWQYQLNWWILFTHWNKRMIFIILWWCNNWHFKILNLVLTKPQLTLNWIILNNNYITILYFETFFHTIKISFRMRKTFTWWTNHIKSTVHFHPINYCIRKVRVHYFTSQTYSQTNPSNFVMDFYCPWLFWV